jgi:tellurite resistance protein TehA-like permease
VGPPTEVGRIYVGIGRDLPLRHASCARDHEREEVPYSLTWWSFTFPVGTVVTGTSVLALATHADFLRYASVALYAMLIAAWLTAATRTARGALNGRLFLPPPAAPTAVHPAG